MRPALSCTAAIWCGWATADSILLAADIQVIRRETERAERKAGGAEKARDAQERRAKVRRLLAGQTARVIFFLYAARKLGDAAGE